MYEAILACMEIGVTLCIYITITKIIIQKNLEIPFTFVTGLISIKPNMNISINLCDMSVILFKGHSLQQIYADFMQLKKLPEIYWQRNSKITGATNFWPKRIFTQRKNNFGQNRPAM